MDDRNAGVLYSGGKDSTYAVEKLRNSGFEISCLITMVSQNAHSYMLHTSNIRVADLCARALEIPIVLGHTKGEKESELSDIKYTIREARKEFGFTHLGSGALCSEYQKSRVDKIAKEIGLSPVAPLWGVDQASYVSEIVNKGYNFILTSVSAAGLDDGWLGRTIDKQAARELLDLASKYRFNPALEGGEGETIVLDCPLYQRNRVEIAEAVKKWNGYEGILEIKTARLVNKEIHPGQNPVETSEILRTLHRTTRLSE
jgi:ABC transporter with metal-binding/Fe-S-binding domain ATP-binding protein